MSVALDTFIQKRFAEINAEEADLRTRLIELQVEKDTLAKALHAARGVVPKRTPEASPVQVARETLSEVSVTGVAVAAVRDADRALSSSEIIVAVNSRLGLSLTRKQIGPKLSKLVEAKKLVRSGDGYASPAP